MPKAHRILPIVLAALAAATHAAQPPRSSPTALVVGQVIDGTSGRAISGALVAIGGQGAGGVPRVLTGSDGRFLFRGLRAGTYTLSASRMGYVDGLHGQLRPGGPSLPLVLADGERNGDVVIRVWRRAAISGTLVDEAGERQVGVMVRAFRRTVIAGARRFVPAGSATTDDRGVYRVGGLIPGDYTVGTVSRYASLPSGSFRESGWMSTSGPIGTEVANATVSGAMVVSGDAVLTLSRGTPLPPAKGSLLGIYPPAYHPFSPAGEGASVITIRAGEEHEGADLQIAPVLGVRVSGFVSGPDGPLGGMALRLVAGGGPDRSLEGDWLSATSDRNGFFTFPVVPAGQYSLRTNRGTPQVTRFQTQSAPLLWADEPVSVGKEDIRNLGIVCRAGLRISGRIEFDGSKTRPPSFNAVNIAIEPVEPSTAVPSAVVGGTAVNVAGEFTSAGLPAGHYYVRVPNSPGGWMFLSATLDGRDVTDVPLALSSDTAGVVVRFTDRWSGLQGAVQNASGRDPAALVIVFPSDLEAWGSTGATPRRMRAVRTSRNGEFNVNLPPGDYHVAAVPDEQAADWQDPEVLHAISRLATRVTVTPGDRRVVDLRTRPLR